MKIFILFGITFACGFFGNFISNANPLPYEAIFNFGDSTSDTGNAAFDHLNVMEKLIPYGSTYFKHASGRQSNGRLIIDFIAEAYGLPFLPAYKNITKIPDDIKKGVNFAYAGSTALDVKYFSGISGVSAPKESLNVQFDWFKKLKPDLCKSKEECDSFFKNSLFIVGEIGGNDIFYHLSKTITELREKVPLMVESIKNTTNALIEEGAVELVVPGNFPMGCNTDILSKKISQKKEDYDEFGCLIAYNTLIEYFNEQLKKSIETIKQKHPQAKIVYFDYYNDAKRLYQTPQQYGFISDKVEILKACCGGSGPYHHDEYWCGTPNTTVCSDPSKLINWDGPHFTEAAYKQIAKGLIEGPFAYPSLKPAPFKIA